MKLSPKIRSLLTGGFVGAALFLTGCSSASEDQAAAEPACDRDCLTGMMDQYLAALVAHDPAQVPFAEDAKFVENSEPMKPGEGLWQTAVSGPTAFKIYVPDPVSGQIGFLGMMEAELPANPNAKGGPREAGPGPVEAAFRLKVEDGKITEAEHLLARGVAGAQLANLQTLRPAFTQTVPEDQRMDRDEMLRIGASYYDALVNSDGSAAPFADDCVRRENGMQTTGNPPPAEPGFGSMGALGCAAQLNTRTMSYIKRIDPRRVNIADPVQGLVFGLSHFRHPMEEKFLDIVGVPGVERIDVPYEPFDLPAAHVFIVRGGQIHEIEAMGYGLPYNAPTGWE